MLLKVIITLFCASTCGAFESYPSVQINQGILKGKYSISSNGKGFSTFLSIPYAKPPIGELRFMPPVPGDSWEGVRDATKSHEACLQLDFLFSQPPVLQGIEDCMYLNVYTPRLQSNDTLLYPVMIFIHGGGYFSGSGIVYNADYLINYDVILVTFNYRLGPLGFFSTGDEVVPGNNGMKDQSLAIKWVYDNIKFFGGDPEEITLFGESAGAASTHLHYFSRLSKGLFRRGISQSGTAFCRWSLGEMDTVAAKSKQLAHSLNCFNETHTKLLHCLQKIDAKTLVQQTSMFLKWNIEPVVTFMPVIEGNHDNAFLNDHPIKLMKAGKYADVPWITGVNTEEGAVRASALFKQPSLIKDLDQNFSDVMAIILENKYINFNRIRQFYFSEKAINNFTRFELVNLFSDFMFIYWENVAVNLHLQYSSQPVYQYVYGYNHKNSFSQIFGEKEEYYGTCHCDELQSLFPMTFFGKTERTVLEERVSSLISTMWTNFAKTGNPTPTLDSLIQTKWEPATTENLDYLYIGSNLYSAKNMFSNRMNFWKELYSSGNYI